MRMIVVAELFVHFYFYRAARKLSWSSGSPFSLCLGLYHSHMKELAVNENLLGILCFLSRQLLKWDAPCCLVILQKHHIMQIQILNGLYNVTIMCILHTWVSIQFSFQSLTNKFELNGQAIFIILRARWV